MTRQKLGPCTFYLNCTPHTETLSTAPRPRFSRVLLPPGLASLTIAKSRRCNFSTLGNQSAASDHHPPSNAGTIFPVKTSNPLKTPWGRHFCLSNFFGRQE